MKSDTGFKEYLSELRNRALGMLITRSDGDDILDYVNDKYPVNNVELEDGTVSDVNEVARLELIIRMIEDVNLPISAGVIGCLIFILCFFVSFVIVCFAIYIIWFY